MNIAIAAPSRNDNNPSGVIRSTLAEGPPEDAIRLDILVGRILTRLNAPPRIVREHLRINGVGGLHG